MKILKKTMNFNTILPHLSALLALLEFFLITKYIFQEKKKTKKLPFVAITGAAVSSPVSGTHPQPYTSVKSSSEICVGL